jgi:intracellular protein transport protein USO1
LQVPSVIDKRVPDAQVKGQQNGGVKVYVIDGLLDLALSVSSLQAFDARLAACECIKAYFYNHPVIRLHFLRRAIGGHTSGADETANVLTALLRPADGNDFSDPYRYWLAAVLLFHLIFDDAEAKSIAMNVTEGDASNGEEVVTCIQSIAANLITGIQQGRTDRVLVAYLMLLCGWLFEDPDAVNDFLGEGSNVQSLVQAVLQGDRGSVVVQGLCAMLLGIVYEFSTKDSPIPRGTIHAILASRMGRDQYIDRLTKLRRHPLLRDFEVLPQKLGSPSAGELPDVFFDKTFVDFTKDNFSRLLRAIDRDPGMEITVVANGVQKGISREMVDSLRSQLEEKDKALQKVHSDLLSLERQLGQEQADSRRAKETALLDVARIKTVNEAMQRHHEDDIKYGFRNKSKMSYCS